MIEHTGTDERNLEVDSAGIRGHIESAIAQHGQHPDISSIVNGAVEQRDAAIRARNDVERDPKANSLDIKKFRPEDRLRATIRDSIQQVKRKAAVPTAASGLDPEHVAKGPPPDWSLESKASWENLPYGIRTDVLREQNNILEHLVPRLQAHAQLEQVIAPYRDIIPKHMSEPAAVNELFQWFRALKSPQTKATALAMLMNQTGTSLQDVANVVAPQQPQQYQQPQSAAQQTLARFAQDKPAFEAVRYDMARLLQANPEGYNGPDATARHLPP